jgi:hypothetical protein
MLVDIGPRQRGSYAFRPSETGRPPGTGRHSAGTTWAGFATGRYRVLAVRPVPAAVGPLRAAGP